MSKEIKHNSPLPWKWESGVHYSNCYSMVRDKNNCEVVLTWARPQDANAEFICEAVNSHERLIAENKKLTKMLATKFMEQMNSKAFQKLAENNVKLRDLLKEALLRDEFSETEWHDRVKKLLNQIEGK